MGLSASQGRLLLLTARKSDLEFRAQQISQKRLALSQQLEDIAMEYEKATSDRQMKITLTTNGNGTSVTTSKNLTYSTLMCTTSRQDSALTGIKAVDGVNTQAGFEGTTCYRLQDASGAIIVSDVREIPNATAFTENGKVVPNKYTDLKGNVYIVDTYLNTGYTDAYGNKTGPNYLQDCLRNGKYLIEIGQVCTDDNGNVSLAWRGVSWDATTDICDLSYTENDDEAKAKYDRLQAQIQTQDKKLELELDQIETQRSAVKTEIESVNKVIQENIEKTFNVFG